MNIMQPPADYAATLLTFCLGNHQTALAETYNAARSFPQTPCSYWLAVADAIRADMVLAAIVQESAQ